MEQCRHCHYYKPLSHYYKSVHQLTIRYTIIITKQDFVLIVITIKMKVNAYGKDERIKYNKELQKLIKNCPRSNKKH